MEAGIFKTNLPCHMPAYKEGEPHIIRPRPKTKPHPGATKSLVTTFNGPDT